LAAFVAGRGRWVNRSASDDGRIGHAKRAGDDGRAAMDGPRWTGLN